MDSAFGDYENFEGPTLDYAFISTSFAFDNGIYLTYGDFAQDAAGSYIELGYGFSLGVIDATIKYISSDSTLVGPLGDNFLILGLAKSFSFE